MASLTLEVQQLETPDPVLTSKIVTYLKSQGVFDQFRRECMADVDTKVIFISRLRANQLLVLNKAIFVTGCF